MEDVGAFVGEASLSTDDFLDVVLDDPDSLLLNLFEDSGGIKLLFDNSERMGDAGGLVDTELASESVVGLVGGGFIMPVTYLQNEAIAR